MCEFCMQHGEGKKWYLDAKNYGQDLLNDMKKRKELQTVFGRMATSGKTPHEQMEELEKAPGLIRRMIRWKITRSMKQLHYGQVVPIEDVERIFGFVNSIVRTSCVCRKVTVGGEKRYCYGVTLGPDSSRLEGLFNDLPGFSDGPDAKGTEVLSKEEALASFREHEKEGLCHTVWTFLTPFIGGICNCDRLDCLAMQMTVAHKTPTMFRAEYVAETDRDACDGCRQCMRVCQFGAIGYSAANKRASIDARQCYGCGICRSVCRKDAIHLKDRAAVPVAANLW